MATQTTTPADAHASGLANAGASGPPPLQEWLDLVESALHGIHHSLNNRIGSLSAVVELRRMDGADEGELSVDGLAAEIDRLQECNRVVKLLPGEGPAAEEALDVRDVLGDVMRIHQMLPSIKEVPVSVASAVATPVRAERWVLLRTLTLLLRNAKSAAKARGAASVDASIEADEQSVRVAFRFHPMGSDGSGETPGLSRYAQLLAERLAGETRVVDGAVELRMPTLRARRAADRR